MDDGSGNSLLRIATTNSFWWWIICYWIIVQQYSFNRIRLGTRECNYLVIYQKEEAMKSSNIKGILAVVVLGVIGLLAITSLKLGSRSTIKDATKDVQNSPSVTRQTELSVGAPFPDFNVKDIDSKAITRDSLKGKPAIIWFTTSWCVPCQIGAKEVSRLDNELGGKVFEVLVVFVDPKENNNDLRNWRKNFANDDWMVAFDNDLTNLAKRVNLKFLDSKFLLDKDGIIKNIDFQIADENYLNVIKQIVKKIHEGPFDS